MRTQLTGKTGRWALLAALTLTLLVMACASGSVDPARRELGGAENAVNQAQAGNAREYAPLELRIAEEKLALAHNAMGDEKYTEALRLAEQASADARVAEAKAQDARTQQMVRTLQDSIVELRQEIEHNQTAK